MGGAMGRNPIVLSEMRHSFQVLRGSGMLWFTFLKPSLAAVCEEQRDRWNQCKA